MAAEPAPLFVGVSCIIDFRKVFRGVTMTVDCRHSFPDHEWTD
jgi:hypothetical protein